MSKEIIQFDQSMFESKLDRMVHEKVEQIVNQMLDAEADGIRQRLVLRANRRTQGVSRGPQNSQAQGRGVPQPGDRTLPATRGKR